MEEFYNTMPDVLSLVDGKLIARESVMKPSVFKGEIGLTGKFIFILPQFSTFGVGLFNHENTIKAYFGINTHENHFETEEWNSDDNSNLLKQVVDLAYETPFEDSLIKIINLISPRFETLYE